MKNRKPSINDLNMPNLHESPYPKRFHWFKRSRQLRHQANRGIEHQVHHFMNAELSPLSTSKLHRNIQRFDRLGAHAKYQHVNKLYKGRHNSNRFIADEMPLNEKISKLGIKTTTDDVSFVAKFVRPVKSFFNRITGKTRRIQQAEDTKAQAQAKQISKSAQDISKMSSESGDVINNTISALGETKGIFHSMSLYKEQKIADSLTVNNPYIYRLFAQKQLKSYQGQPGHKHDVRALKQLCKLNLSSYDNQLRHDLPQSEQFDNPQLDADKSMYQYIHDQVHNDDGINRIRTNLSGELKYNFLTSYATSLSQRYPFNSAENPLLGLVKVQFKLPHEYPHMSQKTYVWADRQEQKLSVKLMSHAQMIGYDSRLQHNHDVKYADREYSKSQKLNSNIVRHTESNVTRAQKAVQRKQIKKQTHIIRHDTKSTDRQAEQASQTLSKASPLLKRKKLNLTASQHKRLSAYNENANIKLNIVKHVPTNVKQQVQHVTNAAFLTNKLIRNIKSQAHGSDRQNRLRREIKSSEPFSAIAPFKSLHDMRRYNNSIKARKHLAAPQKNNSPHLDYKKIHKLLNKRNAGLKRADNTYKQAARNRVQDEHKFQKQRRDFTKHSRRISQMMHHKNHRGLTGPER